MFLFRSPTGISFLASVQNAKLQKDGSLTTEALHKFLRWLDTSGDSEGETYLEMRRRLVAYFDRKNCAAPDELADETINRVARWLTDGGAVETHTPAKYCYTTARFVFLEHLRTRTKEQQFRTEKRMETATERENPDFREREERMRTCLEGCASRLAPKNKELILRYYSGRQREKIDDRRAQARELGMTANALAIRACRIRDQLELCVRECLTHDETIS